MTGSVRHLPRVVDVASAVVERAAAVPADVDRVAFLAHWSEDRRQSRSTMRLIGELQRLGYRVIVSSSSPADGPLDFESPDVRTDELTVLRRPNLGYDFGSWAVAMAAHTELLHRSYVLLVNDSLVGPFAPIDGVIQDFEASTADVWGLVESSQFARHLQSFFRGFRYGCLAETAMRRFWRDLRVIPEKSDLIGHYEYGFSEFLTRHGFSTTSLVRHDDVVRAGLNPTILGWERLLDAGVPFVKRELVRFPHLAPDGHRLPEVVSERYGTDVSAWL